MQHKVIELPNAGSLGEPAIPAIRLAVEAALDQVRGGRSQVCIDELHHHGPEDDWSDLEIMVEVDEELVVPFRLEDADLLSVLYGDERGFAGAVAETCELVLDHAESLVEKQRSVWAQCEEFTDRHNATGLRLLATSVSLAPQDQWDDPAEAVFEIEFTGLGGNLNRTEIRTQFHPGDDLDELLARELQAQRSRSVLLDQPRPAGAHGRADELAIAVMRSRGDPSLYAAAMREEFLALDDGSSLHWDNGVLRYSGSPMKGVHCHGDTVTIEGSWLPEAKAEAIRGAPLGVLVDEPIVRDMRIRSVSTRFEAGRPLTEVVLDLSTVFFSADDGRTWPLR